MTTSLQPPARVTPNLFGIPFGVCGLAQCWTVAHDLLDITGWPSTVLWVLAAVLWAVVLGAYLRQVVPTRRFGSELQDPTFAPFMALGAIVPMLLGVALAEVHPVAGRVVFLISLAATLLFGAWLTGTWIARDMTLAQWHPGYFLPTVAGGLIAAGGCAALGYHDLARMLFGYGVICWLALGSVLLQRLFVGPRLAPPLLPTMAIEVAPPVVAGSAWFEINGGRTDAVALALAGYGALMVLVQLRLMPLYATSPFGPGWWSFSFSYAAVFVLAIRWLAAADVAGRTPLAWLLLAVVTAGLTTLAARTAVRLGRGDFLPRPAATSPSVTEPARST